MVVYIAGKYSGNSRSEVADNIFKAERVGMEMLAAGMTPLIPHKNTAFWEYEPTFSSWSHADWLQKVCLPLLAKCDAIVMMPGWQDSAGAVQEHAYAVAAGKQIIYHV